MPSALSKSAKKPERKSGKTKFPCYAYSRSNCTLGDKCKKEHRPLTAEEAKKRDQREEEFKSKGKKAPWLSRSGGNRDRHKGKTDSGKGKPKAVKFDPNVAKDDSRKLVPCRYYKSAEGCSKGQACPFSHG